MEQMDSVLIHSVENGFSFKNNGLSVEKKDSEWR